MSEAQVSALDSARQSLEAAKASLTEARTDLDSASKTLASIQPDDYESAAAYAKALKSARAAVTAAEDSIAFWEGKTAAAEMVSAPLELEALRRDVKDAV